MQVGLSRSLNYGGQPKRTYTPTSGTVPRANNIVPKHLASLSAPNPSNVTRVTSTPLSAVTRNPAAGAPLAAPRLTSPVPSATLNAVVGSNPGTSSAPSVSPSLTPNPVPPTPVVQSAATMQPVGAAPTPVSSGSSAPSSAPGAITPFPHQSNISSQTLKGGNVAFNNQAFQGYHIAGHIFVDPTQLGITNVQQMNGKYFVNGQPVESRVVDGKVLLQVPALASALGGTSAYNAANNTVSVNIPQSSGSTQGVANTGGQEIQNANNEANNVSNLGNYAAGVGTGESGSIGNAQGQSALTQGTAGAASAMDLANAADLSNPQYLQSLLQGQMDNFAAQEMGQVQNAYKSQLGQLAAQGIAQGGAPMNVWQSLMGQAVGGINNQQANLLNLLLQNRQQNALAAGSLGSQAVSNLNVPFGQQMSIAGLQDQNLGQAMQGYGSAANIYSNLGLGLLNPLTQYYSDMALAPGLQQLFAGMLPQLGALFPNGGALG